MKKKAFISRKITRDYRQVIYATPEKVFPLLCPVRETEWFDGWEYEMIYSKSGIVEEGAVFSSPSPGEEDFIWVVTKHDSESHEVEFSMFISYITRRSVEDSSIRKRE